MTALWKMPPVPGAYSCAQRIDDFTIAYTTTRYFFILINHPYFGYNTEGGI